MIHLKSSQEIEIMTKGGKILARILRELKENTKEGISGKDLEFLAEKMIKEYNVISSFKNYPSHQKNKNFPSCLCLSINKEVVHGIPSDRKIKKGDLVGLDLGIKYQGFHTDAAISFVCQEKEISENLEEKKKLIQITEKALEIGISKARAGNYLEEIGQSIEEFVEKNGFFVVKALGGHGIGQELHEEPIVLNFKSKEQRIKLESGMCFTIEPMVNIGTSEVKWLENGWTVVNACGKLSCHFEHTIAILKDKTLVLTKE